MWRPLVSLIRSGKYDIIYSTCGGASMPMMLAAGVSRFKGVTVVSERNILFPPNKSRWKRRVMIWVKSVLYKRASWVTAVSKGVERECIEMLGVKPQKTIVVNNPIINQTLLQGKQEEVHHPFFQKFDHVILAVGRFEWQKDYDTLLKAFELLFEKFSVGLFILGKGPLQSRYESMVQEKGMMASVCFAGFDKNPFKFMSHSSVFALSSRHEGMPGVLIQAMASGVSCVSTDCPTGPNELINDGQNGFLVPVEDYKSLAERISLLLEDQSLRRKFISEGAMSVRRYEEMPGVQSYFNFLVS